MLIPVILSGGAGTRLWPLSRELYPKQFLPLVGERTMIQDTALRSIGLPDVSGPIVVCNEAHRFLVAEQLRQIGVEPRSILLEPAGRNTAPAVAIVRGPRRAGALGLVLQLAARGAADELCPTPRRAWALFPAGALGLSILSLLSSVDRLRGGIVWRGRRYGA